VTTISFFSQSTNDNIQNFGNLEFVIEQEGWGIIFLLMLKLVQVFLPETVNKGGAEK
jgi:hypothetical protein